VWDVSIISVSNTPTGTDMTAQIPETDPDNERVSRNVRIQLTLAGLTQRELAEIIGRERSWVTDRLNGRVLWRVMDVTKVARSLDCPLDALMIGLLPDALPGAGEAELVSTTTED
jgi:transcriptional regulator with XRE-family HTH domain